MVAAPEETRGEPSLRSDPWSPNLDQLWDRRPGCPQRGRPAHQNWTVDVPVSGRAPARRRPSLGNGSNRGPFNL